MAAVANPKVPRRAPKPLQGEGTPERLLESLAARGHEDDRSWPERDLAFVATALLTGLRLSELLSLDVGSLDGREGERRLRWARAPRCASYLSRHLSRPSSPLTSSPARPASRPRGPAPALPTSSTATAGASAAVAPSTSSPRPTAPPALGPGRTGPTRCLSGSPSHLPPPPPGRPGRRLPPARSAAQGGAHRCPVRGLAALALGRGNISSVPVPMRTRHSPTAPTPGQQGWSTKASP